MRKVERISDAETLLDEEGRIAAVEVDEPPNPVTIVRAIAEWRATAWREATGSTLAGEQEPREENEDRRRPDEPPEPHCRCGNSKQRAPSREGDKILSGQQESHDSHAEPPL